MIDYFALFEEARHPWLDPEKLKEKYFALARSRPADAELNEGFRVLSDPKLRLQHLLSLRDVDLKTPRDIPPTLAELFWETGQLLRAADRWHLKNTQANSVLSRALLGGEQMKLKEQLGALEARLNSAYVVQIEQLQAIDSLSGPNDIGALLRLHDAFSYLARLRDQVKEKQLLLA
jgi:hypothetical protein